MEHLFHQLIMLNALRVGFFCVAFNVSVLVLLAVLSNHKQDEKRDGDAHNN